MITKNRFNQFKMVDNNPYLKYDTEVLLMIEFQ